MNRSIVICLIFSLILNSFIFSSHNNNSFKKDQNVQYSLDYCDGIDPNCGDN